MKIQTAKVVNKNLYEQDYCQWLEFTVQQLRSGHFNAVDWENLIEEIEDMGRSEKRALASLLTKLFEHLLKLAYWETERAYNANKWKSKITTFRVQIKKLIKQSPSLKPYLAEIFTECYLDGRKIISRLTGFTIDVFPSDAIASIEQVLDEDWFPNYN